MCIICSNTVLLDKTLGNHKVILGGKNLKMWRTETMNLLQYHLGRDYRIENLSFEQGHQYDSLFKNVFKARVHPIYWNLLDSKPHWNLQHLWFKLGDAHNNGPLLIFFWNQLLHQGRQSAFCLLNDIYEFRHLINEYNSIGILSSLYGAVPIELNSFAIQDIAEQIASLGLLLKRLKRFQRFPNPTENQIAKWAFLDRRTDDSLINKPDFSMRIIRQSYWKWNKNYLHNSFE